MFGIRTILIHLPPILPYGTSYFGAIIDSKFLREYRCPTCHRLLAKGQLMNKDSVLEVKCRGCETICQFQGEDAEIIQKRAELLREGKLKDPDENRAA